MSFDAVLAAWNVDVGPTTQLVLQSLAMHQNRDTGYTFPGGDRIAHETRLHVRTVRRELAHLEELGIAKVVDRGHSGKATVYTLDFSAAPIKPEFDRGTRPRRDSESPSGAESWSGGESGKGGGLPPLRGSESVEGGRVPPQPQGTTTENGKGTTTFLAADSKSSADGGEESFEIGELREEMEALVASDAVRKSTVVKIAGPIAQSRGRRKPRSYTEIIGGIHGWDAPEMFLDLLNAVGERIATGRTP